MQEQQETNIKTKQEQQQGFEQFYQSKTQNQNVDIRGSSFTTTQTPRIMSAALTKNISTNTNIKIKSVTSSISKKSQIKMKIKPNLDIPMPPKKQSKNFQSKSQNQKSFHNQRQKQTSSPVKLSIKHNKLQRIPIMRKQQYYRNLGPIVYKSFAPRSSQTYFRLLKQADQTQISSQTPLKVGEFEYDLYMRVDTNTLGHRQWFYFSVRNQTPGIVRFNILRFKKKFSLFQRQMRPYVWSVKSGKGWIPGCNKISYRIEKPTGFEAKNSNESNTYYLTFQYKFQESQDEVYFASGLPYTLSYLNKRLDKWSLIDQNEIIFQISNAGKSLAGQNIPLLTISPKNETGKYNYLIINCRTHPGETSCSWVLDGLLEKILKDNKIKKWINEANICIKIIPILNPDGVFIGNYRTGLIGQDFNRKFESGKKDLYPQIHSLRKLIQDCKKKGKIFLFLDLHGHSVLKNSFIYGPDESLFTNHPRNFTHYLVRTLPFTIWHHSKYFKLSSCKYVFAKCMNETARVHYQNKQNILTFTCQTSLGLFQNGEITYQMATQDYKSLGSSIIESIIELLPKNTVLTYDPSKQITSMGKIPNISESPQKRKHMKQNQQKLRLQKDRQTCLDKIKNAKKQLQQQTTQNLKNSKNSSKLLKNKNYKNKQINSLQKNGQQTSRNIQKISQEKNKLTQRRNSYQKQTQFKIRRKSDFIKILPQAIRKKIITNNNTNNSYSQLQNSQNNIKNNKTLEENYPELKSQHSLQHQTNYKHINKTSQITEQEQQDFILNDNFSQQYQSINDSDGSSQDLDQQEKQYLIECIHNNNNTKLQTKSDQPNQYQSLESQQPPSHSTIPFNLNVFKEVKFSPIESHQLAGFRSTKKEQIKSKQHSNYSNTVMIDDQFNMPQMIQRKQLNERAQKMNKRQPYLLVQIKKQKL